MNAIVPFSNTDLALIRRTVAKDCLPHEFDQFIHICRAIGLDPLRRQIYAFVFGKGGADDDRNLTVVTAIDGYRSISARSGDYRPADKPTLFEIDEALKSPSNPHGIVRAEVTLYKWSHGDWFPVIGEAFWDEYCPTAYAEDDVSWVDTGKTYKRGPKAGKPIFKRVPKDGAKMIIDPARTGWAKGPRNQIAKCAEAQAHRKGWPNDFAGVLVEEEIDRLKTIDLTATEIADVVEQEDRMAKIGGPSMLIIDWIDGKPLASVPADKFLGVAMDFIKSCEGQPNTVKTFSDRNKVSLRHFWGIKGDEALELKKALEEAEKQPDDGSQIDLEECIAKVAGNA
jgi:phage recombination protein Bet